MKVYESEVEGCDRKGRPLGRWKDRVEKYLGERGFHGREVLEQAGEGEVETLMPWAAP